MIPNMCCTKNNKPNKRWTQDNWVGGPNMNSKKVMQAYHGLKKICWAKRNNSSSEHRTIELTTPTWTQRESCDNWQNKPKLTRCLTPTPNKRTIVARSTVRGRVYPPYNFHEQPLCGMLFSLSIFTHSLYHLI